MYLWLLWMLITSSHVDIGDYGSNSDGGIFKNSKFGQAFMNNELGIPHPKSLPNWPEGGVLSHCIVADEAFPLRCDLMRPYPRTNNRQTLQEDQKIFNYRLSRARRIVENAFGILAQRWRIFNRRINLLLKNVDSHEEFIYHIFHQARRICYMATKQNTLTYYADYFKATCCKQHTMVNKYTMWINFG